MAKDNIIRLNASRYSPGLLPEETTINDIAQRLKRLEREVRKINQRSEAAEPYGRAQDTREQEEKRKSILALRGNATEKIVRPQALGKTYVASALPASQTILNATARRLLAATCGGTVFITFHSYQIPAMHTLTGELREEEKLGGFSADDPADDTFMADIRPERSPDVKQEITPEPVVAKPPAVKPTIDVAKLREPQPAAKPHTAAPSDSELEVQREGLKWVRILVLSGISIIFAMVILAWFLASKSSLPPVEQKQVMQFSPAEPSPKPIQQSNPIEQETPAVMTPAKPAASGKHIMMQNMNANETAIPDESITGQQAQGERYEIQILATPRRTEAEDMVASLKARGADAFVSATMRNNIDFFRVRIGNYASERDAQDAVRRLGLHSAWIEKVN